MGMMVVVLGICFCTVTFAGDKAQAKDAKKGAAEVKGVVKVEKDGDTVKSISVAGKDGKQYVVVLDDTSKGLAALDGKTVLIHGTEAADGKLTVADFKEKAAKEDKKDAGTKKK